jgi:hypothetical protein
MPKPSPAPPLPGSGAKREMKMSPSEGANRRRSERVMLQIPIVVTTETLEHEKLREETQTMIVNAHGGLVKLQMEVMAGQPIMLTHPRSGVTAAARVVRVENPPGGFTVVAFEFQEASPKFWPVEFPPADWVSSTS